MWQLSNALLAVLTSTRTDTCLPLVDTTLKLLTRPAGSQAKPPLLPEVKPGYFRPVALVTEANPLAGVSNPCPWGPHSAKINTNVDQYKINHGGFF